MQERHRIQQVRSKDMHAIHDMIFMHSYAADLGCLVQHPFYKAGSTVAASECSASTRPSGSAGIVAAMSCRRMITRLADRAQRLRWLGAVSQDWLSETGDRLEQQAQYPT